MKTEALLLAQLLNAEAPADKQIQYELLRAMIPPISAQEEVDGDAFALLVEDNVTGHAVSTRRAARLLRDTGAFTLEDGLWQYAAPQQLNGAPLPWETFVSLFTEPERRAQSLHVERATVEQSIRSAVSWMTEMTLMALHSGTIDGQPAFYLCHGDHDSIIGFKAAGTATSDSLTMLCENTDVLSNCGRSPQDLRACVSFLLEKTLASQCLETGWDSGGFYPLEDQPDSTHPTVDATCLAVLALCSFLEKREALEACTGAPIAVPDEIVMQAVLNGLSFLFRMQLDNGAFSIYRYESGLPAQANENCTRIAQSTMGACKGSGIFDRTGHEELYPRCSQVIAGTWAFLSAHAANQEGRRLWAPYLGENIPDYPIADILVSSARVCRAFIPVWWQMEEQRPALRSFWRSLADFWSDHVDEAETEIGVYRFNTPGSNSFSDGEYMWYSHPDMLTAFTLLQAYNHFGFSLSARNRELILRAVSHALSMQHPHGHWDNPLAKGTPFCAVTLAAIELLREYLRAFGKE